MCSTFRSFSRPTRTAWALTGLLFAFVSACATDEGAAPEPSAPVQVATAVTPAPEPGSGETAPPNAAEEAATEQEIDTVIASVDDTVEEEDLGPQQGTKPGVGDEISHATTEKIPLEINADVERWIEYFSVKDRDRFQRFMERGEKYRPQLMAVLRDQGIPTEIYYQAMIESGFSCAATSSASAVGVWQFIRETGRRYGLRVDSYVDERRDPMRATIAAAIYMKDLYNVFQSWYLAMAAYNSGEGRIMATIMRSKTRDFWEMVKKHELPDETMNYIPKFLAATIIGHNPAKYGFDELHPDLMPTLVSVPVPSPVRLSDIAQVSGIPLESLKDYNPHLLRGVTPPGVASYRIWVPKDQATSLEAQSDRLAALRLHNQKAAVAEVAPPQYHTVARGETLAKVAGLYGVSVKQLRKLNHLRSGRLLAGTKLLLRARGPGGKTAARVAAQPQLPRKYKVKRGDNLEVIAVRFGLSVGDLKKLNRLKRSKLYIGQVLKVGDAEKG